MSMGSIKYYKDLNHNYLIIKDKVKEAGSYQHKMITANRMKFFLACKIRYVDEECHFYYEISSKQNLPGLFGKGQMHYKQIRRLFECMREALAELENYLLDSRCLVLQPEYIFGNPETEEYFFLYYPYYMENEAEASYMPLAEFLVEKTDHTQDEATAIVYKIYEMAQDNEFILSVLLDLFAEEAPETGEREETVIDRTEEADISFVKNADFPIYPKEPEEEERVPKQLAAAGILAFMCMVSAAGVFSLRYFFVLSGEEMILSITGSIVLIIMTAALLLYLMFNFFGRKRYSNGTQENTDAAGTAEAASMENFYPESISGDAMIPCRELKETARKNRNTDTDTEEIEYGNTVFLEDAVCKTEHKLYGTNKGNKYHIDLEHLPCTVGKMAGIVDVVIKDSTISRIHARFTREEEGICVTDMNSTNGTFKNGLRLEPNETVLIEQGDELRFGRMTFCYR